MNALKCRTVAELHECILKVQVLIKSVRVFVHVFCMYNTACIIINFIHDSFRSTELISGGNYNSLCLSCKLVYNCSFC